MRAIETDVMMDSAFRRLVSAIEGEREQIRNTWQQLQQDREVTAAELEQLRRDTEDWCTSEKQKIDSEWKRLDRLSERMVDFWPKQCEIIKINCSGHVYELPRATLCCIEGSYLAELFDEENSKAILPDADGCYYLDINPHCFGILVEYLLNRRLRVDAPLPIIPQAQQLNMELLAEAWQLKPFLRENRINPVHVTSLHVSGPSVTHTGSIIVATHPGWQVISSQRPLPLASASLFEVKILRNPAAGTSGGLAIGVCNHIPQGPEIHTIRLQGSVIYNSNNGLIGDGIDEDEANNVTKNLLFAPGATIGVRHDPNTHSLTWFYNGQNMGTSAIRPEALDRMRQLYPVFALYVPEQTIQVDFRPVAKVAAALEDEAIY